MALDSKQKSVVKGMLTGAILAVLIIVLGSWLNPFAFRAELSGFARLSVAIKSSLLPAIFLAIAIARLARHRLFSPEDIDGGGLSQGSHQATLLQSLLQNTLEQFALALITYCAWAVIMPAIWLSTVPLAALAFAIGRIMFFTGYKYGAPARAIGFTLAFYPSIMMLTIVTVSAFIAFIN